MEKQAKLYQHKILKFLPKAASVVTFHHNLPFSPNKDKRFSGTIVPMIPHGARIRRRRPVNGLDSPEDDGNQEPTSPKISCMGKIKHEKKKRVVVVKDSKPVTWSPREVKKRASKIKRMFSRAIVKPGRKSSATAASSPSSDEDHDHDDHDLYSTFSGPASLPDRAPSLSQMKKFSAGRDRMASFDWTAVQVAPVDADHRNIHSSEDDEDDDDVIIPFSPPLEIIIDINQVPLQPRREINLWKRRTMTPPRPLDLNTL